MMTPEQHHDRLIQEILFELTTYGPRSMAAIVATLLENDESSAEWVRFARLFRVIEDQR